MARMNGEDILLLANTGTALTPVYEELATQRSLTNNRTRAWIDLSAKGDDIEVGSAGRRSYPVTVECVYDPDDNGYEAIKAAFEANDPILIRRSENGTDIEEATAVILSMNESAPDAAAATVSIEMRITNGWRVVGS